MKWIKVAPPHIVALVAIAITAFSTWSKYDIHSQWAVWLFALPLLYALLRTFTSVARLNASLNVKQAATKIPFNSWIVELPFALRTLVLGMLVIALARPQTSDSVEDMTSEGIDLVLAMDVSLSMLSKDFKPNRLEQSKDVAEDFIDQRPHDRIGIVAYEGEAFSGSGDYRPCSCKKRYPRLKNRYARGRHSNRYGISNSRKSS